MTIRRVVALAQALTMILLLAPGPDAVAPSPASAAVRRAAPSPDARVLDASGKGIGCLAGTRRYKGPKDPKDPPWPPGDAPSPSPEPSVEPTIEPSLEPTPESLPEPSPAPSAEPSPGPSLEAKDSPTYSAGPTASPGLEAWYGPTILLAGDVAPGSSPGPEQDDADIAPDVETPQQVQEQAVASHFISGIDVSHHNGDIDYTKVRQAGNAFVFAKATQDNEFIDPMFLTNVARARAAGLTMGGYHFFDYTLDGRAQADHFVDRLELAGAIDDALPPVVDVECWAPIGSSIHAVSAARLRDFVARVYERTGRLPIIYTSVFMWKQVVGNANGFEDLPLWAACWGCEAPPSIAPGWEDWAFWQTGVNRIKGVGRLDGNYFAGSIEDLESLRLRPLAIAAGAPVTADQRVHIDIGGRTATHLRTSPDGQSWSDWRAIRSMPRATLSALEGPQTLYVQLRSGARLESPVYRDAITLDRSGPEVTSPTLSLRVGPLESEPVGVPVEVAWQAVDATAGLSDASLEMACDSAGPSSSEVPGSAEPGQQVPWSGALRVPIDRCDITVVSRDGVGNESRTEAGEVELVIHPADAGADSDADADSVATTGLAGDQVGVMAVRGPDRGRANVLLDGEPVGLVDLYAPEATGPELVLVVDLASGARQRISVEATGDRDPAASGGSVAIEGFVTLATG